MLSVWLFNGVWIRVGESGPVVRPQGSPAQRLLAYLALNRGRPIPRDRIARDIWGEGRVDDNLRGALMNLRRAFVGAGADPDDHIPAPTGAGSGAGTIMLRESAWVDVIRFEETVGTAPAEALKLARGPFLGAIKDCGPWLQVRREVLRDSVGDAYLTVSRELWASGKHAEAIVFAEQACETNPSDLRFVSELIRHLARDGQTAAAIGVAERSIGHFHGAERVALTDLLEQVAGGRFGPEAETDRDPGDAGTANPAYPDPRKGRAGETPTPRLALFVVTAGVLAAIGLAALIIDGGASGGDKTAAATDPCPPSLTAPDPRDLAAIDAGEAIARPPRVREVDVGERPAVAVTGWDGIWVGQAQGLALIDPADERAESNLVQTDSAVYAIALSKDRVWATLRDGTLLSVDRATRKVVGEPLDYDADAGDVALAGGSVWVNNYGVESLDGTISRIDPCGGEIRRVEVGRSAVTVKPSGDEIWVSDPANGTIARVDSETESVTTTGGFSDPQDLIVRDDQAWVIQYTDQSVQRVDPRTGMPTGSPIRIGPDPGGIALGAGAVWVPLYGNGSLTRLPLAAERASVGAIQVGVSPTDVAVGFGRVWVPNNGADTVSVYGPRR